MAGTGPAQADSGQQPVQNVPLNSGNIKDPTTMLLQLGVAEARSAPGQLDYSQIPSMTQWTGQPITIPGSSNPYQGTIDLGQNVRMPQQPTMRPTNAPTGNFYGQTSYQREMESQQNLANAFGNIARGISNKIDQDKYQKDVGVITDVVGAIKKTQEANIVLANDPNNADALAALKSANDTIKKYHDPKYQKILQKAIPNWTEPNKSDPLATQGVPQAIKTNNELDRWEANNKTVAEAKTSKLADMIQGKPTVPFNQLMPGGQGLLQQAAPQAQGQSVPGGQSIPQQQGGGGLPQGMPAPQQVTPQQRTQTSPQPNLTGSTPNPMAAYPELQRVMANAPKGVGINPAFQAAYEHQQKLQEDYIKSVLPRFVTAITQKYVTDSREAGLNAREDTRLATELVQGAQKIEAELAVAGIRADEDFNKTVMNNAASITRANIQASAITGDMSYLGKDATSNPKFEMLQTKAREENMKQWDTMIASGNKAIDDLRNRNIQLKGLINTDKDNAQTYQNEIAKNEALIKAQGLFVDSATKRKAELLQEWNNEDKENKPFAGDTQSSGTQQRQPTSLFREGSSIDKFGNWIGSKLGFNITDPNAPATQGGQGGGQPVKTTPQNLETIGQAIGLAEGFGANPTNVPSRTHNRGDLKIGDIGYGTTPNGITIFPNDQMGDRALQQQLNSIATGKSKRYNLDMNLYDMGKVWVGNDPRDNPKAWSETVAKKLGVDPNTKLRAIFAGGSGVAATAAAGSAYSSGTDTAEDKASDEEDKAIERISSINTITTGPDSDSGDTTTDEVRSDVERDRQPDRDTD